MEFPHVSHALGVVHPICLERGANAEVWDEQGQRYIDFVAGIGVLNPGHDHPRVQAAIQAQLGKLTHSAFNALPHRGYLDLAQALDTFVPVSYPLICMLTNSGVEATENALKLARAHTGRTAVIAFDDAFHGRTLAALNIAALRVLELSEQVAAATLLAGLQGVHLRDDPLPESLRAMVGTLEDFAPVGEDRALDGELRLCLERIRARYWALYR